MFSSNAEPLYAHIVAKRCCPLNRRQAAQEAILQRAAKPNFSPLEEHTFANARGFRDKVPPSPLLAQFPTDFGRIVLSVKPYSPSLPLSPSIRTVPPVTVRREVPHLDCSYCAP